MNFLLSFIDSLMRFSSFFNDFNWILRESKEKTSVDGGTLLSLSQYTGIMPKDSTNKMGMFEAESTVGYNIVHPGQFVMNIMLAWNGSYAVSDYEGVISPAYCVFNFNVDCEKKYFHYLFSF